MQKPPDEVFIQVFTFTPRRLATDHLDVPTDVSRLRPDGKQLVTCSRAGCRETRRKQRPSTCESLSSSQVLCSPSNDLQLHLYSTRAEHAQRRLHLFVLSVPEHVMKGPAARYE